MSEIYNSRNLIDVLDTPLMTKDDAIYNSRNLIDVLDSSLQYVATLIYNSRNLIDVLDIIGILCVLVSTTVEIL